MDTVRAKKHLGQHFLKDLGIARRIAEALGNEPQNVLEIGPGMGVLTQFLLANPNYNLKVIEIDTESVEYLQHNFPSLEGRILSADFLQCDLSALFCGNFSLIGNYPYNISNQILFRVFENRNRIPTVAGMFQKEVAERIAAKPGSKTYGILRSLKSFTVDAQVNKEVCYLVNWTCLNKSGVPWGSESDDVTLLAMQNHWLPTQGLEQDPTHGG